MPPFETFFNRAVKDYMRKKFYILKADDTVATAVKVMKENNIGSVGVQFENGPVGIVTDRDIVMKVVSVSGDPAKVKLQDIAVRNPITVSQDASLEEAFKLMRDNGILRLIVLDDRSRPFGLLVERWVFASFVSEILGEKREEPHGWLDRYVRDVTDAALMED
jgi:predicted transcriptional regulator